MKSYNVFSYYCPFHIFQKVVSCLVRYTRDFILHKRFANFCNDLKQHNLLKLPMHKTFYSRHGFFKNQIFSLFPILKMNTNHAEICRVDNLEADFQEILLVQFFLKFSQYSCETSILQIQQKT